MLPRLALLQLLLPLCLLALLPTAYAALPSKPGLSQMEKDSLCACREFHTPRSKLESRVDRDVQGRDEWCVANGFHTRWLPMFTPGVELGVGLGLRAQVYVNQPSIPVSSMLVAFKHFEHDPEHYIDRDGWQSYVMWEEGFWPSATFSLRHYLAIDYTREASNMMTELLGRPKAPDRVFFTGFGEGGSIAAIQATRYPSTTAVVFMAHGVGQLLGYYGYPPTKRVTNIVVNSGLGLKGTHVGRVCEFPDVMPLPTLIELLYDAGGLISLNHSSRECKDVGFAAGDAGGSREQAEL